MPKRNGCATQTYINNLCLLLTDCLKIPLPDLSRDRLTDRAENPEVLHLVAHKLVAGALQQPQSCGRNVELRNLVLLDDVPVPREIGVGGRTFEDDG